MRQRRKYGKLERARLSETKLAKQSLRWSALTTLATGLAVFISAIATAISAYQAYVLSSSQRLFVEQQILVNQIQSCGDFLDKYSALAFIFSHGLDKIEKGDDSGWDELEQLIGQKTEQSRLGEAYFNSRFFSSKLFFPPSTQARMLKIQEQLRGIFIGIESTFRAAQRESFPYRGKPFKALQLESIDRKLRKIRDQWDDMCANLISTVPEK